MKEVAGFFKINMVGLVHKAQNGQAVENSVKVGNNLALP